MALSNPPLYIILIIHVSDPSNRKPVKVRCFSPIPALGPQRINDEHRCVVWLDGGNVGNHRHIHSLDPLAFQQERNIFLPQTFLVPDKLAEVVLQDEQVVFAKFSDKRLTESQLVL
jgi:hypothetical protein